MLDARSFRELMLPVPMLKVAVEPEAVVSVNEDCGRVAVALEAKSEYHEAVVARLLTPTVWFPVTVPLAAEAVTALEFDEVTDRDDNGPVSEFNESKSL